MVTTIDFLVEREVTLTFVPRGIVLWAASGFEWLSLLPVQDL